MTLVTRHLTKEEVKSQVESNIRYYAEGRRTITAKEGYVELVSNHIFENYCVLTLTQKELDSFVDSAAIENAFDILEIFNYES